MSKERNREIADETLKITDAGRYTLDDVEVTFDMAPALEGTELFTPEDLAALKPVDLDRAMSIEVTQESTQAAAERLLATHDDVAILNFASARWIGGGFLKGSRAQEEELCRCSGLYRCLERAPEYYTQNRKERGGLYTDHLIYSPHVPFFRDTARDLVKTPRTLSVLTAPAPNTKGLVDEQHLQVEDAFRRRARYVLAAFAARGHRHIVLGAWGCGAFGGDPKFVADVFAALLEGDFKASFETVVFGVLVMRDADLENFRAFDERFS